MDWIDLLIGLVGGGGITTVITSLISKKKSPYDLYTEFIQTQREWMERTSQELEREKVDSAEKSYIIARTRLCEVKRKHPDVECPVDAANDDRLRHKCKECSGKISSES